jgi:hypothetical protein
VDLSTLALFKEMYSCLGLALRLEGLMINLLEAGPRVSSELLTLTVDRVELRKLGGNDRAEFSIHHIQVDDMRERSRVPVVFQPVDSGKGSAEGIGASHICLDLMRCVDFTRQGGMRSGGRTHRSSSTFASCWSRTCCPLG